MKIEVEKSQGQSYYVVHRLYKYPKKGYCWEDEQRIFTTVIAAEQYIRMNASQGERYATDRFQVIEYKQIELVTAKQEVRND